MSLTTEAAAQRILAYGAIVVAVLAVPLFYGVGGCDISSSLTQAESEAAKRAEKGLFYRERAMNSDMRAIVLALAAVKIRSGSYPEALQFVPVERLQQRIDADSRLGLPSEDPWGTSYHYWSNGVETVLLAFGRDKSPDRDYNQVVQDIPRIRALLGCGELNRTLEEDSIFVGRSRCRGNQLDAGPDAFVDERGNTTEQ